MLKRASISEIKDQKITKADGYLVVTMRMYPRFLSKSSIHDYRQSLAPQKELFERYRELKKETNDQNYSFEKAGYQKLFQLSPLGLRELAELAELSKKQDVYMICQCQRNERCHVDLMLLIAEREFNAKIDSLPFDYSVYRSNR